MLLYAVICCQSLNLQVMPCWVKMPLMANLVKHLALTPNLLAFIWSYCVHMCTSLQQLILTQQVLLKEHIRVCQRL